MEQWSANALTEMETSAPILHFKGGHVSQVHSPKCVLKHVRDALPLGIRPTALTTAWSISLNINLMGNTVQALGKGLFTLCAYDINQKGAVFEFNKVFFFFSISNKHRFRVWESEWETFSGKWNEKLTHLTKLYRGMVMYAIDSMACQEISQECYLFFSFSSLLF